MQFSELFDKTINPNPGVVDADANRDADANTIPRTLILAIPDKITLEGVVFVATRIGFMFEIMPAVDYDNFGSDTAAIMLFMSNLPPFLGTTTIVEKPAIGSFFWGLQYIYTLMAKNNAYIGCIGTIDAIQSMVGIHYFFLKNIAILHSRGDVSTAIGSSVTTNQLKILINVYKLIFQANQIALLAGLNKLERTLSTSPAYKAHNLNYKLLQNMIDGMTIITKIDEITPSLTFTLAVYDFLFKDVYVPTVILK
jgi:hypothetical protein